MNRLKQHAIAHSSNSASRLSLGRIRPKTRRSFRDRNGTGLCLRIHRAITIDQKRRLFEPSPTLIVNPRICLFSRLG
jgi:hypothetical protein